MTKNMLMVLLEIDNGSYHACQIGRGQNHNKETMTAQKQLIEHGYVSWIGDELLLTQQAVDLINELESRITDL